MGDIIYNTYDVINRDCDRHRNNGVLSAREDVMSCKVPMVSCMQWVWFHMYIGCDVISQVGLITYIH